jgi:acetyltransferase-like isoleucine patch superfamily enzyme
MLIKKQRIPVVQIALIGFLPSPLKKFYFKLRGYQFGKNVNIGLGSVIIGKKVSIGDNTKIGFMSVIRANEIELKRFIRIGSMVFIDTEKVFIDDDARINENVIVAGIKYPDSLFSLGKRTIIMEYSYVNPTKPIIIGDDSGIGGHCLLFTHGSWLPQIDGFPVAFAPITLGKRVWLPWRVFIMPGVNIGDNVVIGANSLVAKSLPSNCLAAGSPASIIKENYPPTLSKEKRAGIVDTIFSDFINHLKHHSYNVELVNKEDFSSIKVSGNNSFYTLYYINSTSSLNELQIESNDLIIIDNEQLNILENKIDCKMIIDYHNKERKGTSALGEEFVSFISRFGIRFNRLD